MEWGRLFNDNWEFSINMDSIPESDAFNPVEIPHDWLIYDSCNLYKSDTGWYRKKIILEKRLEKLYFLRFDGVYMDSTVYVNGIKCGEWKYGYSAFTINITESLKTGENEILVKVVYQSPNSRWYSGAGIYRNVWFQETEQIWLIQDGTYISTEMEDDNTWRVNVNAEVGIMNDKSTSDLSVCFRVFESKFNGKWNTAELETETNYSQSQISKYGEELQEGQKTAAEGQVLLNSFDKNNSNSKENIINAGVQLQITRPTLWNPEAPCLYVLEQTLMEKDRIIQKEYIRFGLRHLEYRPDSGFWLNHKHIKLKGVCEHHDLGCLGAAYNQAAMRRKFKILKNMGVNAVRTAHNMPSAELMDLADEMGILVVSEGFDMWESPKTAYDYARFFPEWYASDVSSWIRRDRNHPSIIMWSIGNEIHDTHEGERGRQITKALCAEVRKHDPKANAPMTIGSNYMPWENAQKCADMVKLAGYNYSEKYYDCHHRKHPDWIIYGSETSSTVQSRGVYHFPYSKQVLADQDEQCSALGNSTTSWGAASSEYCIIFERDNTFSCGQFIWSGFDYIGEPTPYHTKNSYFGQIDTAGFPKDSYYIYQGSWRDEEKGNILHLFPYWDFNEGQTVDVRAASNAAYIELFLNGKSQGIRNIDIRKGNTLTGDWSVIYEPGEIRAVAYDGNKKKVSEAVRKSFGDAAHIICSPDRTSFLADGKDLIFIEISMTDQYGNPVENANNRVQINVQGNGKLAGTDNGDSTDYDSYKDSSRCLFGGKLLAVVQSRSSQGEVLVTVSGEGLPQETITLYAKPCGISLKEKEASGERHKTIDLNKEVKVEIPVRKIQISNRGNRILTAKQPETELMAELFPVNTNYTELFWSVVDDGGIPSHLAEIKWNGNKARVKAKGDGRFWVRCMSKNGQNHIRLISQLDLEAVGFGAAYLNPYGFICGGSYQYEKGNPGNGNEHGVASARDGETQVGYRNLDFGQAGSDEITIPIFALDSEPVRIRIWEGMPGENNSLQIGDVIYQKPSIWNVYQEETFQLDKKLKGITSICFVVDKKIHIKGFSFTRQYSGFEKVNIVDCKHIYGDSFRMEQDGVYEIGNNVTLEFDEMDFGEEGAGGLILCGHSPITCNTIHLRFIDRITGSEVRNIMEFSESDEMCEKYYRLDNIKGRQNVFFIFMPGSRFDFKWFRFLKDEPGEKENK